MILILIKKISLQRSIYQVHTLPRDCRTKSPAEEGHLRQERPLRRLHHEHRDPRRQQRGAERRGHHRHHHRVGQGAGGACVGDSFRY